MLMVAGKPSAIKAVSDRCELPRLPCGARRLTRKPAPLEILFYFCSRLLQPVPTCSRSPAILVTMIAYLGTCIYVQEARYGGKLRISSSALARTVISRKCTYATGVHKPSAIVTSSRSRCSFRRKPYLEFIAIAGY